MRDNRIISVDNPFDTYTRKITPVPFMVGRNVGDILSLSGLTSQQVVIVRNGKRETNLNALVYPGDVFHVFPMIHGDNPARSLSLIALTAVAFYVVGPAATGFAGAAGMGASAASFWGSAAALATITVGGMVLNSVMSPPETNYGNRDDSPTYGWSTGRNTAMEGIAIPVIYGVEATWPNIINQWVEVDGSDQWAHTLLCVGEGKTNNVPTADDIYIDGQPISILPESSYVIETTDGSIDPTSPLTNHDKLHQNRPIVKDLERSKLSQILLHFDGDNDSTVIVDSSVGVADDPDVENDTVHVNVWTCQSTAAISTTHPFAGTGALDLETSGDYISCDEPLSFSVWTKYGWDFEVRFRQDSLTNSGIIGQQCVNAGGDSYYWGIFYYGGSIVFQQYKKDSGSSYTVYANASETASLSIDTWHHIRVAVETAYSVSDVFTSLTAYIFLDGVLLGSTAHTTNEPVLPTTGTWQQTVGKAQYYTGSADSIVYGVCELDELRLYTYGHLYAMTGFTPPTNPIADDGTQSFYTHGKIDSFRITVRCPYGIYQQLSDGGLGNGWVGLWVSYRKEGSSAWIRKHVAIWEASRSPVTKQFEFVPDAGRGIYQINVDRLQWWNADADGTAYQATCQLMSIDEILHEQLYYPHLQLVSISILAQDKLSGTIPQYRVTSNRSSIIVPRYDGTGSRTVDPTNNANCVFDMFTNSVYGPGVSASRFVESDMEAWADYCDVMIGANKRCQINMAFDQRYSLDEALQNVESCGRAKILQRGTKITPVIDKPREASHLFDPANITIGTCRTKYVRQAERSDAVEITYRNADNNFIDDTVRSVCSDYNSLVRVARVTKINMRGINNTNQAQREAILRQQISEATKKIVSFQSGLEGLPVLYGDVFDHASGNNEKAFSGRLAMGASRVERYTGTTVYLDNEITLDTDTFDGNCILIVRDHDDAIYQHTVTGPFDTATRSITISASGEFGYLSPYMIIRSTGEVYQYRVVKLQRSSTTDVAIEGSQYVSTAYYHNNYAGGTIAI